MEIKGVEAVVLKMQAMAAKARLDFDASVSVGYTAKYALYIHENTLMRWRGLPRDRSIRLNSDGTVTTGYAGNKQPGLFWGPTGQAKFLEGPFRELEQELIDMVVKGVVEQKLTMAQSLVRAGLYLQRVSMQRVPVLTGNLRASAFTRLEHKRAADVPTK